MTGTSTVVLQQSDDGRESSQQGQPDSVIKLKTGPSEIDPKGASSQPPSASAAAAAAAAVVSVYEEVPFADLEFVEDDGMYYYECPCGDMFELSVEQVARGEEIARCPSCSLAIRVIYPQAQPEGK
uniref:Diphthamide biosynthesis protein 3 n=1 Tax=Chrysotila carterae TaxID=13221 RepID=A0A7S4EXU1_CHRCT